MGSKDPNGQSSHIEAIWSDDAWEAQTQNCIAALWTNHRRIFIFRYSPAPTCVIIYEKMGLCSYSYSVTGINDYEVCIIVIGPAGLWWINKVSLREYLYH